MRSLAGLASLAALFLAGALAEASSSLVLTDGQIIKGTDVKREGDSYLVTMSDGNTVAFPSALVKEVKIEDDPETVQPPQGFDYSGPKTLAGYGEYTSQDPKDQLKVFGGPTSWPKNVVDTTWVPTSAYDPDVDVMAGSRTTWSKNAIDTTVVPKSAYEPIVDVMAGSRSTWAKNAVDTTWKPTDSWGFKPITFGGTSPDTTAPYTSAASAASAAPAVPSAPAPWTCAEKLFAKDSDRPETDKDNRSSSMDLRSLKDSRYASLGLPLYEASGKVAGVSRKAVFTIAGDECRLLGGDADTLIGLNLSTDHAMAQDAASFNAAMAARGGARVPAGVGTLDYALAFISLTDPLVSGSSAATLKLIAKPEGSAVGKSARRPGRSPLRRSQPAKTATSPRS
jgi:hypothetical protein